TFDGAGYHGVTIESADGATFSGDTFSNIAEDAVDLEYDDYPTVFVDGQPTVAAEDHVTFTSDTWVDDGGVWFASLQGQQVQENDVTITDNTLKGTPLTVQIRGNSDVPNDGLTIAGNTSDTTVGGGSIASSTNIGAGAVDLTYVDNVTMEGNTVPLFDGTPTYYHDHPYQTAVTAWGVAGFVLRRNDFSGANAVLQADPRGWAGAPTSVTSDCGNSYGVGGGQVDQVCS
ncbi:MAG: hypothetical protein ACRDZQ_10380, partial [Acidimicrobiales bacterium]